VVLIEVIQKKPFGFVLQGLWQFGRLHGIQTIVQAGQSLMIELGLRRKSEVSMSEHISSRRMLSLS